LRLPGGKVAKPVRPPDPEPDGDCWSPVVRSRWPLPHRAPTSGARQWVDDGIVVIQNLHLLEFCHKLW